MNETNYLYQVKRGGIAGFQVRQQAETTGFYYVGRGLSVPFQKGEFVPRRPFWTLSECYLKLTFLQKLALFFGKTILVQSNQDLLEGHRPV